MATTNMRLPEMVHPPIPGETHPFYGDLHNRKLLLPSIKAKKYPSAEWMVRQESLYTTAQQGNIERVQALLMHEGEPLNVNLASSSTGMTVLHYAASRGHLQIVQLLVDQCGAIVDMADREGETALLKAAFHGHFSVVQCLIHRRTNVHHRDRYGWTALHNACANGHSGIVRLLVELGKANVNCQSQLGHTPLMNAASKGFIDIVEYLLQDEKTDPLLKNHHGETSYDAAAENSFATVCDMLEEAERSWWIRPHGEAASYTGAYDLLTLHTTVLVMLHENERAYQPFSSILITQPLKYAASALLRTDRRVNWTQPPSHFPCKQNEIGLPDSHWYWMTDWEVDLAHPSCDEEGWEYAPSFDDDLSWASNPPGQKQSVRRRRWIRVMKKCIEIDGIQQQAIMTSSMLDPRDFLQKEKILGSTKSEKKSFLKKADQLEHMNDPLGLVNGGAEGNRGEGSSNHQHRQSAFSYVPSPTSTPNINNNNNRNYSNSRKYTSNKILGDGK